MIKKLRYILLILAALIGGDSWAQTTSYVLNVLKDNYYEFNTIETGDEYTLTGPGLELSFEVYKLSSAAFEYFYVEAYYNGKWNDFKNPDITTSWTEFKYTLPSGVEKIRFLTKTGATGRKRLRKVKVTRATTLSTDASLNVGDFNIGSSPKQTNVNVTYNNTTYNQTLTGSCDNTAFTVSSRTMYETGTEPVTINFYTTTPGVHTGKVTLSMAGKTTTFTVTGTAFATYKFSAEASPNNANYGSATASVANASITSSNASATTTATFSAAAKAGYEFVGWGTTQGATSYESTANPYQTNITNSAHGSTVTKTLYAIFRPVFRFSASAEKIYDYGTVSASVADKLLGEPSATSLSAQATFTATPNAGCTFEGWYADREHTQLVSKDATCKPTITNSTVGSIANLTLYAWFKSNQTITWTNNIQDFNLIQGLSVDCSAKSDKGLKVSYRSSNNGVASVDENGLVTGNAASNEQVVITAYQEGNDEFNAAVAITRTFRVLQKLQPDFEVSGFSGNTPVLKVEDVASITLSNVDGEFTYSSSDNAVVGIARSGDVLTLTALKEGTSRVVLSQPANNTHNAASAEYNITVERHQGGLTVTLPEAMKVGESLNGFWKTANSEVPVVVESSHPNVLSYSEGKLTAVGEGTALVTVSQAETNKWVGESRQQTITVSKVANTLGVSLGALETKVGNSIAVSLLNQNNTETPVVATITDQTLSSEVNEGTDVISYANGVITAKNAGTAKITFSQNASAKYEAFTSSTYEITVTKNANPISVSLNGGVALSIKLKYGATASLAYTSANTETQCVVTRTSGNYTTLAGNTITAGNTAGTDTYLVTQAETHKYEEGYAMFSVRVNNTEEEEGYVLYDETVYSRDVGGVLHTYELSGPGEILYYSANRVSGAIYYNFYAEYSIDGSSWIVAHDNTSIGTSYKDFSCLIPETARYVRFRNRDGGTLNKHVKNVKVPRKTYVRAASDKTNLGTVYTGTPVQTTFTVDYSTTNGGNIHVNSSNPNFVVSAEELSVNTHSNGTKTFTVTYTPNPDQLGEESALVTVSDLFYTQEITLQATAAKRENTLKVVGDQNLKVGDVVDNVYSGKNSDAELKVSVSSEGIVSYDAVSNRLTAIGEGSAVVTIFQNANDSHLGITRTINVNVSKTANTLFMAIGENSLKVGESTSVSFNGKNSDGPITATYSVDGVVEYRDGEIVALKAGSTRVTLTQSATVAYTSASQSFDITVSKHDQVVQWDNELTGKQLELNIGQTLDTNTAKASSGLAVTYSSSNPSALSVDPTTGRLTALASGIDVTITATQAGNDIYNAASVTRSFVVISKMDATVITSLSSSGTNELRIGGGSVTIGCVTPISAENFTISGEDGVVATSFDSNTLTITPIKIGEVYITLTKDEDESYYAINETFHILVLGAQAELRPDEALSMDLMEYAEITLARTFTEGHSTLALPFDTDISDFSDSPEAYAAQLALVTHNKVDGYTLFFKKVDDGHMLANQPYVIYLPSTRHSFVWTDVTINSVTPLDKVEGNDERFQGWIMRANYTPEVSMEGNYGIVGGKLCLGSAGSTINGFTAYFIPPAEAKGRVRVAMLDNDGTTTYIHSLSDTKSDKEGTAIYRLDGTKQSALTKGINIVRMQDGSVRKVLK